MATKKSTKATEDGKKNLMTIGWVKSIDLYAKTFTIEPISAYRFQVDEKDDNSWKIIFKDESKGNAVDSLILCDKEKNFKSDNNLIPVVLILKQNKSRVKVFIKSINAGNISCQINVL